MRRGNRKNSESEVSKLSGKVKEETWYVAPKTIHVKISDWKPLELMTPGTIFTTRGIVGIVNPGKKFTDLNTGIVCRIDALEAHLAGEVYKITIDGSAPKQKKG